MNKYRFFQGLSRAFSIESHLGAPPPRDIYFQSETKTNLPTITDNLSETGSPQDNSIVTRSETGSSQPMPPETMSLNDSSRSLTSEAGSAHSQTISIDRKPETVAPQCSTVETEPYQPSPSDIRPPPSLLYFPPNYSYGCLDKKWSL